MATAISDRQLLERACGGAQTAPFLVHLAKTFPRSPLARVKETEQKYPRNELAPLADDLIPGKLEPNTFRF